MLSLGIGSSGEGQHTFSVRLPFSLSSGKKLNLSADTRFELLGHKCEVTEEPYQYVLTVGGFASQSEASAFLAKACSGLIWFGLQHSVGCTFNPNPSPIDLFAKPRAIHPRSPIAEIARQRGWHEYDGHYDFDKTIVRPDHKRLIVFGAGRVDLTVSYGTARLSAAMLETMGYGRPELVLTDSKLRLACEVYLSSYFEATPAASFLSCITTLEVLIPDTRAPALVRSMVERFVDESKQAQDNPENVAFQKELKSLVSGLERLQDVSISRRIRDLVEDELKLDPGEFDPAKTAKEVGRYYNLRSGLLHNGKGDQERIKNANSRLKQVVPQILKARFRRTAKPS